MQCCPASAAVRSRIIHNSYPISGASETTKLAQMPSAAPRRPPFRAEQPCSACPASRSQLGRLSAGFDWLSSGVMWRAKHGTVDSRLLLYSPTLVLQVLPYRRNKRVEKPTHICIKCSENHADVFIDQQDRILGHGFANVLDDDASLFVGPVVKHSAQIVCLLQRS